MATGSPPSPPKPGGAAPEDRLESWKEIAAYLRREVRTVQRWEKKEGLPIHRLLHDKQGTVYAFKNEIDGWWKERSARLEHEPAESSGDFPAPPVAEAPAPAPAPAEPADQRADTRAEKLIRAPVKKLARPVSVPLGILILLIAAVAYFAWRYWPRPQAVQTTIAVLPFDNVSGDPEQEFLGQGLMEEMITQLGLLQPESLSVIGRQSSMRYQQSNASIAEIGRALKADYLVDGSYGRFGDRVRITAQLYDARTESQLWTQRYERDLRDVLTLQSEVAQAIAAGIRLKLTPTEQARLASPRPVIPEAYLAYVRGRYSINRRDIDGMTNGVKFFNEAIGYDPKYALAYAGIADAYNLLGFYSAAPPRDVYPKSKEAAGRALAIDDSLAEAHAALADVHLHFEYDWKAAESRFLRAIQRNPNYPTAHHWYAVELALMGRTDEARSRMELAMRLDPVSPPIATDLALVLYYARQFDAAVEQCSRALEIEPHYHMGHFWLGRAYLQKGLNKEAIREFQKARDLQPSNLLALSLQGHAMAVSGQREEAQATVRWLQEQSKTRYISPTLIALVYVGLNERDKAFAWAEKAYEARDPLLTRLKMDPILDSMRSDPRFPPLVKRIGPPE